MSLPLYIVVTEETWPSDYGHNPSVSQSREYFLDRRDAEERRAAIERSRRRNRWITGVDIETETAFGEPESQLADLPDMTL